MNRKFFAYRKGKSISSMSLGTKALLPTPENQELFLERWQLKERHMMGTH